MLLGFALFTAFGAAQVQAFSLDDVGTEAKNLADKAYETPKNNLPKSLRDLKFADYQQIQVRYDELIPAMIPLSQMVDSVVVRNEVKNFQSHPSATTFLREVYKTGGDK